MDKEAIINRLCANAGEVITQDELRERLNSSDKLTHYIGFEISGYVHLGTGLMSALIMKDLTDLGVKCTIWLADWHSAINGKLDGTQATAARIGQGYFTEAMQASYAAVGGNPEDLEFRLASNWLQKDFPKYWETLLTVARHTSLSRILRSIDITGKAAGDNTDYARTLYPAMQAADIFYQNIDIAHAGLDQRKIHAVVRDVAHKVTPSRPKPIAIHHALLPSLNGKQLKMSKSSPDTAIFVHDTPEDITRKIKKAFATEKDIENNPVLNWTKSLLFYARQHPFRIERGPQHGGDVEFNEYDQLEEAYASGDIHPTDLKNALTQELINLLTPVRQHFAKPEVQAKKQALDKILKNA